MRKAMPRIPAALFALACLALSGCEQLGIDDPKKAEADGRAVGAACRQAGRALEDCYQLNPSSPKAAIFSGWREMNDYMSAHRIADVKPLLPPQLPKGVKDRQAASDSDSDTDTKDGKDNKDSSSDKGETAASKP